ncbi:MAG: isochorismatase family protein [Candidatus Harrisonbacteria bacterium]|nr:isochorismatase family protein [Candidatus Harrisonbacteria bacterium]
MARAVLILVDVQNDFCPGGALAVKDGDKVVEPLNRMADFALRKGWIIIASRDWHPAETRHFNTGGGLWPPHCVQNTEGAKFHKDLKVEQAIVVSKGMDLNDDGGYSAFDGVTDIGMNLLRVLRVAGVEEVYVGGLATDYCVKATALSAVRAGFKTYFLSDGSRAVNINPGDGDRAVEEMVRSGVISLSIETFLLFRDRG